MIQRYSQVRLYETLPGFELVDNPQGSMVMFTDHIAEMKRVKDALRKLLRHAKVMETCAGYIGYSEEMEDARALLAEEDDMGNRESARIAAPKMVGQRELTDEVVRKARYLFCVNSSENDADMRAAIEYALSAREAQSNDR